MAILSISFMAVFTSYLVSIERTNLSIQMTSDSQNLLRVMVEELRYGAGVRQNNTLSDPNEPAGGWNTGNTNFVIITAVPAQDSSRQYIIDPLTGDPYFNENVYFKQANDLYKRVIANPAAVGNSAQTSCPAAIANTPACSGPADSRIAENIDTMTFTLYDQNNNTPAAAPDARSILINLRLSKETFGDPVIFDNSIRITLRNQF